MTARRASPSDIDHTAKLIEAQRRAYAAHQPVMLKKAANSEELTRRFFLRLIGDPVTVTLVSAREDGIEGFLIAREIAAPPVFDPGGATVLVDDFCVRAPSLWASAGRDLLEALARERKPTWRQVIVVCADADKAKAALLADFGLTVASNWWTAPFS